MTLHGKAGEGLRAAGIQMLCRVWPTVQETELRGHICRWPRLEISGAMVRIAGATEEISGATVKRYKYHLPNKVEPVLSGPHINWSPIITQSPGKVPKI